MTELNVAIHEKVVFYQNPAVAPRPCAFTKGFGRIRSVTKLPLVSIAGANRSCQTRLIHGCNSCDFSLRTQRQLLAYLFAGCVDFAALRTERGRHAGWSESCAGALVEPEELAVLQIVAVVDIAVAAVELAGLVDIVQIGLPELLRQIRLRLVFESGAPHSVSVLPDRRTCRIRYRIFLCLLLSSSVGRCELHQELAGRLVAELVAALELVALELVALELAAASVLEAALVLAVALELVEPSEPSVPEAYFASVQVVPVPEMVHCRRHIPVLRKAVPRLLPAFAELVAVG